jgi:hypothetical protein
LAVAVYRSGLYEARDAERFGYSRPLEEAWTDFRREHRREPTVEEWRTLLDAELRRAAEEQKARKAEEAEEFRQKVERIERRAAAALSPEAVAGLQSAQAGRTAVLSASVPGVVVKLADDPAFDLAVIDHTWFRHAVALKEPASKESLNVVNLFPDPIGDALLREVNKYLGERNATEKSAASTLRDMLTGQRPFEEETLAQALSAVAGRTFYVISHIPEAAPGAGSVEFDRGGTSVRVPIVKLQSAFKAAKVNLFIVGCSSSQHAATGLSKEINNVDALSGFLEALKTSVNRPLFGWHAAFAADAKVVIDLFATEVFGRDAAADALSKVTLEMDGRLRSTGYVGTFAPPPAPLAASEPPSLPLSIALGAISIPTDNASSVCNAKPSLAQVEMASKLAPLATILLFLNLGVGWNLLLRAELKKDKGEREYGGILLAPLMVGLPITITWYQWQNCSGCMWDPGPYLPMWCMLYAAVFTWAWTIGEKRHFDSVLIAAMAFGIAGALFGVSYLGWGADPSVQTFCDAVVRR